MTDTIIANGLFLLVTVVVAMFVFLVYLDITH